MNRSPLIIVGGASLDILHFQGRTEPSIGGAELYTALAAHRAGAQVTMFAPRPDPMPAPLAPAAERLNWIGPAPCQNGELCQGTERGRGCDWKPCYNSCPYSFNSVFVVTASISA